jgi:hypothetical protein
MIIPREYIIRKRILYSTLAALSVWAGCIYAQLHSEDTHYQMKIKELTSLTFQLPNADKSLLKKFVEDYPNLKPSPSSSSH